MHCVIEIWLVHLVSCIFKMLVCLLVWTKLRVWTTRWASCLAELACAFWAAFRVGDSLFDTIVHNTNITLTKLNAYTGRIISLSFLVVAGDGQPIEIDTIDLRAPTSQVTVYHAFLVQAILL